MDKIRKIGDDYGHCIIKEELIISDSDEEIDVETVDKEIEPTKHKKPKEDVKTAVCDIDTLAKNLANAYCKKCKKESVVIRQAARCSKCKTPFSYICHSCEKSYINFTSLRYHIKNKHIEVRQSYPCSVCQRTFTNRKILLYHRRSTHKIYASLQCSNCGKKFSRSGNKALHERFCGGEKRIYKCDKCSYIVRRRWSIIRHIMTKHSEFKEKCETCQKVFKDSCSLKKHLEINCNKKKIYECDHCSHKVHRKDQMVNHLNQFLKKGYCNNKRHRNKICQDCGLTLARYERMKHHRMICQSGLPIYIGPLKGQPRICRYCGEAMKPREPMRYHVKRCESAPLILRFAAEKTKLPNLATAMTKLSISYCSKCKIKAPVKYRVRRCGQCNKRLRFACVSCPRYFDEKKQLHIHLQRNHVRNLSFYHCDKCRCSYIRKWNLMIHLKDCHSDQPSTTDHKCENCGKRYKSKESLRNHKVSCGQEPKFYCDYCTYKTHFKYCINNHIWVKHSDAFTATD